MAAPSCASVFGPSPDVRTTRVSYLDPDLYQQHAARFPDKPVDRDAAAWSRSTRSQLYMSLVVPKFFNTPRWRTAPTDGAFAASYVEERPKWESDYIPRIPQPRSRAYWMYATQPYYNLFVWRGSGDEASFPKFIQSSASIPGESHGADFSLINVRSTIRNLLQKLYADFGSQGPERKMLVPIVEEQDNRDLDRTTHFQIGHVVQTPDGVMKTEGSGHLQMMVSHGAHEPLHVEDQWGALKRRRGEVIGELGRFYFSKRDEKISRKALNHDQKTLMRLVLWQKMFAWASWDARIDRVVFQVNDRVRGILIESYGLPLAHANAREVFQEFNGEKVREWIFDLNRKAMLQCEKALMTRLVKTHLQDFLNDDATPAFLKDSVVRMRFSRNEIPALAELGLIDHTVDVYDVARVELSFTHDQARDFLRRH